MMGVRGVYYLIFFLALVCGLILPGVHADPITNITDLAATPGLVNATFNLPLNSTMTGTTIVLTPEPTVTEIIQPVASSLPVNETMTSVPAETLPLTAATNQPTPAPTVTQTFQHEETLPSAANETKIPTPTDTLASSISTIEPTPEPTVRLNKTLNETKAPLSRETLWQSGTLSKSPMNPAFLAYQNQTKQISVKQSRVKESTTVVFNDGSTSHIFLEGEIPAPLDFSYTQGQQVNPDAGKLSEGYSYPSSFDLRSSGRVSPVKDQGNAGACWAFATVASLESSLLPGETWDFSENNMKNTHGFDLGWNDGGNRWMSTAYLTRWSGPVLESDDPYHDDSGISPPGLHTYKHVQDVYFLPQRSSSTDNNNIKDALMNKGAVQASIYWANSYYNPTSYAFYNYGTASTNHAITIVGWDDTYSRANFVTPPGEDGAFIVKNSWGTSWGNSGYFYVSYYDLTIGDKCTVFTGEPVTNYDHVYSYDPLGWVGSIGYSTTFAQYANVFSAQTAETLKAIGVYTTSPGSYTARIYLDPAGGPINSSGYVVQTSWTNSLTGYQTLDVPDVTLRPGQKYSIVVSAITTGYTYPIPIEYPEVYYSSHATANAGESYISSNGATWTDLTTLLSNSNVCVKGYTTTDVPTLTISGITPSSALNSSSVSITNLAGANFYGTPSVKLNRTGYTDIMATGVTVVNSTSITCTFPIMHMPAGQYNVVVINPDAKQAMLKNGFIVMTELPTETGIFRPGIGFYLDKNNNGHWDGTPPDAFLPWELQSGDIPVTGNWTGNGITKTGIFRPGVGFYLDMNNNGHWDSTPPDAFLPWELQSGDIPVTGDWNGDGITETGIFRRGVGFYQDMNNNGHWDGTPTDAFLPWGLQSGDIPVTGRWS